MLLIIVDHTLRSQLMLSFMLRCSAASVGPQLQHVEEVGAALRRIGDELDGDPQLQLYVCSYMLYDVVALPFGALRQL